MNKEKFAIIEIRKIIKGRNGGIFSDKDILETIAVSLTDLNTRISALESASKS